MIDLEGHFVAVSADGPVKRFGVSSSSLAGAAAAGSSGARPAGTVVSLGAGPARRRPHAITHDTKPSFRAHTSEPEAGQRRWSDRVALTTSTTPRSASERR